MPSLPSLRLGYSFVTDSNGNYLVDSSGLFITVPSTIYPFCDDHGVVPAPGVDYSLDAINARLLGVVDAIDVDGNGYLIMRSDRQVNLAVFQLARPCGVVSGGVLTFSGELLDPSAPATGIADNAIIATATGDTVVSELTIGLPGACADILLDNGLGTLAISSGQTISMLSAQIHGT